MEKLLKVGLNKNKIGKTTSRPDLASIQLVGKKVFMFEEFDQNKELV